MPIESTKRFIKIGWKQKQAALHSSNVILTFHKNGKNLKDHVQTSVSKKFLDANNLEIS